MSKYVIDTTLDNVKKVIAMGVTKGGAIWTDTTDIENLEELNSDYINEHFGELQDTAYQKGLNDAWECARKIVCDDTCGGMSMKELVEIFNKSSDAYIIRDYTAQQAIEKIKAYEKKQADKIEVGDEVADKYGDKTIVTNIHGDLFDGLCSDGSTMADLFLDDTRKTGRHFDIESILEAMKA